VLANDFASNCSFRDDNYAIITTSSPSIILLPAVAGHASYLITKRTHVWDNSSSVIMELLARGWLLVVLANDFASNWCSFRDDNYAIIIYKNRSIACPSLECQYISSLADTQASE
jgi:hypothetical protein